MPALTRPTPTALNNGPAATPGPLRGLIRRAPLLSFLVLSCLLSWWPAALYAAGVLAQELDED